MPCIIYSIIPQNEYLKQYNWDDGERKQGDLAFR